LCLQLIEIILYAKFVGSQIFNHDLQFWKSYKDLIWDLVTPGAEENEHKKEKVESRRILYNKELHNL